MAIGFSGGIPTVVPADLRAPLVDGATEVRVQIPARIVDLQKPTFSFYEDRHLLVRDIPAKMIKVFPRAGCVDLHGEIAATLAAAGLTIQYGQFPYGVSSHASLKPAFIWNYLPPDFTGGFATRSRLHHE